MEKVEVTSMSSKGQIVIPIEIREKLGIGEGDKFVVIGGKDTIILKRIMAAEIMQKFDIMLKKARDHVKKHGITPLDAQEAIEKVRGK